MFKNNSVKIKITEQRFQFLLVLEFESELMCFQAQFIVDTSGIFNENAAVFFFCSPLGQNFNIAKLSSSWQTNRKSFFLAFFR